MKTSLIGLFWILVVNLLPLPNASALTWKVIGPCSSTPTHSGSLNADITKSIGALSVLIFDQQNIPYVGSEGGMNSINNSPIGLDAAEVISDTKARFYGWCFSINGKIPDKMPHEVFAKNSSDDLVWFYAYSTSEHNNWIDYCVPSYKIKAAQFCGK